MFKAGQLGIYKGRGSRLWALVDLAALADQPKAVQELATLSAAYIAYAPLGVVL